MQKLNWQSEPIDPVVVSEGDSINLPYVVSAEVSGICDEEDVVYSDNKGNVIC